MNWIYESSRNLFASKILFVLRKLVHSILIFFACNLKKVLPFQVSISLPISFNFSSAGRDDTARVNKAVA
jgi:hypothetical protein